MVKEEKSISEIENAPVILTADNMHLKNGLFALQTDNVKGAYFSDISITPLECYVDPYDEIKVLTQIG